MANRPELEKEVDVTAGTLPVTTADNIDEAYKAAYCKMLLDAAKKHIPRGCRANHILYWDDQCEDLLRFHTEAISSSKRASAATDHFDNQRKERQTETVKSIDFTHSSRRAWQTINKLTGRASKPSPFPLTEDSTTTQLISNGRFTKADKAFTRDITTKLRDFRRAPSFDLALSGDLSAVGRSRSLLNASN